eukprot:scaffold7400_cov100-Isochrysis_galbana.AAC.6
MRCYRSSLARAFRRFTLSFPAIRSTSTCRLVRAPHILHAAGIFRQKGRGRGASVLVQVLHCVAHDGDRRRHI